MYLSHSIVKMFSADLTFSAYCHLVEKTGTEEIVESRLTRNLINLWTFSTVHDEGKYRKTCAEIL